MLPIDSPATRSSLQPGHAWERWDWAWYLLAALVLLAATWLAFLDPSETGQPGGLIGLSLVFAGWYIGMMRGSRLFWGRHPLYAGLWLLLGAGLWAGLIYLHPDYLLLATAIFPVTFLRLPLRWAIGGALILCSILAMGFLQGGSPSENLLVAILAGLIGGSAAALLGLFIASVIGQSRERQQLIEELQAARDELAAAERQAGTLAERQRLSREIHDTLAQGFTSIVMHLEAAEQALPTGADAVTTQHHLDAARRAARESLAKSRRVMLALRPELLERTPLPEAVQHTAEQWANATQLSAQAAVTGIPRPLALEIETTLLRATQKSLANVRKHAHATTVNITLSYMEDAIVLDVQDNGGGFNVAPLEGEGRQANGGFGLQAMRERIEHLGGSLLVESVPGEGTTLVIEIPTVA